MFVRMLEMSSSDKQVPGRTSEYYISPSLGGNLFTRGLLAIGLRSGQTVKGERIGDILTINISSNDICTCN